MSSEKVFESEAQVAQLYKAEGKKVIIFQGVVYDVEEYMTTHPGGGDLIGDELGTNIEEKFEEAEHTKAARRIFRDLPVVGKMKPEEAASTSSSEEKEKANEAEKKLAATKNGAAHMDGGSLNSKFDFDYNRGIWWQIWNTEWTFEEYYDYINDPKVLVNPIRDLRLFDNGVLELLTLTPWFFIPLVYVPIGLYWMSNNECNLIETLVLLVLGVLTWTLFEYSLHRFLFHSEELAIFPRFSKFYAIHFLVHGIHHAFPQDRYRLVFPPILGIVIMQFTIISPVKAISGPYYQWALLAGVDIGYIGYDMIHYFLHHADPKDGYWKMMKVYHMQHHYKNGQLGFGVSNKFWDVVFRTEIIDEQTKGKANSAVKQD
uniref:Fatty acid 2-hydroxylase n=1 Tax=Strombidium rassoulzadegani TaxID=1082188 RepID=A0A7S3CN35_9SPIT